MIPVLETLRQEDHKFKSSLHLLYSETVDSRLEGPLDSVLHISHPIVLVPLMFHLGGMDGTEEWNEGSRS